MQVQSLTPVIGSEIHGLDLSDARSLADHAPALRALLAERQVIFFRDQHLSPDAQAEVARVFGKVEPVSSTFPAHPDNPFVELLVTRGKQTGTDVWHADLTWQAKPPAGACLYAVDVPEVGGDTMWCSMTSAYASLAPKLQAYLDGMVAVHDWEAPALVDNVKGKPDGEALYQDIRRKYPPIGQPVILRHPVTDKPLVFVNALYTTRIEKLSQAESASLVAFLTGLARVPEWQVRFRWRKGSVAIWDNLATQHYAVNDYFPAPRTMHRVSIR